MRWRTARLVTYEELLLSSRRNMAEIKATLEADLIGSFRRTRTHGIRWKGSHHKEVELAVAGLATQLKDMASQAVIRRTWFETIAYEQRHPDLYQDKFKRAVVMVDTEEGEVLRETKK
ncbi:hypothetical protein QYE76_008759 [Lolium multiflorum]|uniref:Uncharacterized protein n=1 Tax=Lolium multiflorum TaxID=4521 RepID=A0AAD8TSA6_LOLMU|nr:hypothetical protein QYE76_008759 [Lolium multiflorum]